MFLGYYAHSWIDLSNFSDFKNASRSYFREEGDDLLPICFWRLPRRRVETIASNCYFVDFFDSRWGGVEKMKKSPSRWGGVAKCKNRAPTLGADHKKKCFPCSMGVPKLIFATPLERERRFHKTWKFCCCEFWWFWCGEKVAKMRQPVRFLIFDQKLKVI